MVVGKEEDANASDQGLAFLVEAGTLQLSSKTRSAAYV